MRIEQWLGAAALTGVALAAPAPAAACGGFFCSSSPVDQAGETVVYSFEDDGTLTMSVRIEFEGDDDDFAWILPVPVPPELSIGSDALFDQLERTTQPTFTALPETRGTCRSHPDCVREDSCEPIYDYGCSFGGGGPSGWSGGTGLPIPPPMADADAGPPSDGSVTGGEFGNGVTVFSEGTVGPYETVVLGATTANDVLAWLADHGYDIPASSEPLLEAYAAQEHVFVALRLAPNTSSRLLQPLTMRMATSEACLPIRLTAIAAVPNMTIRAFFLGDERVVPLNYNTAEIDTSAVDLFQSRGLTYVSHVAEAVDELGGQAFVTDYAGPTPPIDLALEPVADLATELDPATFLRLLNERGYRGDRRILGIFQRYVAPPDADADPTDYYNCLFISDTETCGAPSHYDPARAVAAIEEEIRLPREEAQRIIASHDYVTRLYTVMSPEEMTVDPIFVPDDGMGDVRRSRFAAYVTDCSDEYYSEGAPTFWEVEGEQTQDRYGTAASDTGYCRNLGGIPDYAASTCPEAESSSRGGCALFPGLEMPLTATVPFLGVAVFWLRRRRRVG